MDCQIRYAHTILFFVCHHPGGSFTHAILCIFVSKSVSKSMSMYGPVKLSEHCYWLWFAKRPLSSRLAKKSTGSVVTFRWIKMHFRWSR